jgi:hypothetical protein
MPGKTRRMSKAAKSSSFAASGFRARAESARSGFEPLAWLATRPRHMAAMDVRSVATPFPAP